MAEKETDSVVLTRTEENTKSNKEKWGELLRDALEKNTTAKAVLDEQLVNEGREGGEGEEIMDLAFLLADYRIDRLISIVGSLTLAKYFQTNYLSFRTKYENPEYSDPDDDLLLIVMGIIGIDPYLVNLAIERGASVSGITPDDIISKRNMETKNQGGPFSRLESEILDMQNQKQQTTISKIQDFFKTKLVLDDNVYNFAKNTTPIILLSAVHCSLQEVFVYNADAFDQELLDRQTRNIRKIMQILINAGLTLTEVPTKGLAGIGINQALVLSKCDIQFAKSQELQTRSISFCFYSYISSLSSLLTTVNYYTNKLHKSIIENELITDKLRKSKSNQALLSKVGLSKGDSSTPELKSITLTPIECNRVYNASKFFLECLIKIKEANKDNQDFCFLAVPSDELFILQMKFVDLQETEITDRNITTILYAFSELKTIDLIKGYLDEIEEQKLTLYSEEERNQWLDEFIKRMRQVFSFLTGYMQLGIKKKIEYFKYVATKYFKDEKDRAASTLKKAEASAEAIALALLAELQPEEETKKQKKKRERKEAEAKAATSGPQVSLVEESTTKLSSEPAASSSSAEPSSSASASLASAFLTSSSSSSSSSANYLQNTLDVEEDLLSEWIGVKRYRKELDDQDAQYLQEKSELIRAYNSEITKKQNEPNDNGLKIRMLIQQKYLITNTKWLTMRSKFCNPNEEIQMLLANMATIQKNITVNCNQNKSIYVNIEPLEKVVGVKTSDIHISIHWMDFDAVRETGVVNSESGFFHYKDNGLNIVIPILFNINNQIFELYNPPKPIPRELQIFLDFINTPGFWPIRQNVEVQLGAAGGGGPGFPGLKQEGPKGGFTRKKRPCKKMKKRTYKKRSNKPALYKSKKKKSRKLVKPVKRRIRKRVTKKRRK